MADKVTEHISKVNDELSVMYLSLQEVGDLITVIGKDIDEAYYSEVLNLQLDRGVKRDIRVVYTLQHGICNVPVRYVREIRFVC